MKLTRRALLTTGLGLGQLALLERFGLGNARAQSAPGGGPTKLLSIYIQGAVSYTHLDVYKRQDHHRRRP